MMSLFTFGVFLFWSLVLFDLGEPPEMLFECLQLFHGEKISKCSVKTRVLKYLYFSLFSFFLSVFWILKFL